MLAISGSGKIAHEVINSFPNLLNKGIGNFKSVKMAWDDGIKRLVAVTEDEFVVKASKITSNTSEFLKNILVKAALLEIPKQIILIQNREMSFYLVNNEYNK